MATAKRTKKDEPSGGEELSGTLAEIKKQFGPVVSSGSDKYQPERISTGSFMLDFCTLGGIPTGRISKFVGHKHAGKSMMADKVIASTQRMRPDQRVVKVDLEGTHDAVWSSKLGVNNDDLLVVQSETGEAALDMTDALIHTKEVSLIVVDSLAQLVPAKEIEASAEDQFIGLQARMIGSFVRKAVAALSAEKLRGHDVALLFINQFRTKVGGYSPHGDPLTEPGGKGLGFAYSLEVTIKNKENKGKDAYDVETIVTNDHAFSITKNKMNGGPREGEFSMCRVPKDELGLAIGDIDDAGTMLAYAKKFGAYGGGGASWTLDFWDEEHVFRNLEDGKQRLYENPELLWKLRNFLICEQATHLGMPDDFLERFYP